MTSKAKVREHLLNCLGRAGIATTGSQLDAFTELLLEDRGVVKLASIACEPHAVHLLVDEKRHNLPMLAFLDREVAVRQCLLANGDPHRHTHTGIRSDYGVLEVPLAARNREYNQNWRKDLPGLPDEWFWRNID